MSDPVTHEGDFVSMIERVRPRPGVRVMFLFGQQMCRLNYYTTRDGQGASLVTTHRVGTYDAYNPHVHASFPIPVTCTTKTGDYDMWWLTAPVVATMNGYFIAFKKILDEGRFTDVVYSATSHTDTMFAKGLYTKTSDEIRAFLTDKIHGLGELSYESVCRDPYDADAEAASKVAGTELMEAAVLNPEPA